MEVDKLKLLLLILLLCLLLVIVVCSNVRTPPWTEQDLKSLEDSKTVPLVYVKF